MAVSYQYNASGYYVSEAEDNGFPPNNSTHVAPPKKPWGQKWPQYTNKKWVLVEDHRERKAPYFLEEFTQEATEFWLPPPFGEDDFQSQARTMKEAGPLPEGHSLTCPEKPLAVAQDEKRREIDAGYESALVAALTMPSAAPTPMTVAMETSALLAVDPDGVDSIKAVLDARRGELRAAVDNAESVTAVAAVVVSYPV